VYCAASFRSGFRARCCKQALPSHYCVITVQTPWWMPVQQQARCCVVLRRSCSFGSAEQPEGLRGGAPPLGRRSGPSNMRTSVWYWGWAHSKACDVLRGPTQELRHDQFAASAHRQMGALLMLPSNLRCEQTTSQATRSSSGPSHDCPKAPSAARSPCFPCGRTLDALVHLAWTQPRQALTCDTPTPILTLR